jgi:hypothetical protein
MAGIPNRLQLRAALMDLDEFTADETLWTVMRNSPLRPMRQRST